jgi:nucleotide-binding universal stress UspA family protein
MFNRILATADFSKGADTAIAYASTLAARSGANLHVLQAASSNAITRYARANNIDLIVIGTRGRGRGANLLIGRVAENVARAAPCPVLTMRGALRMHGGARWLLVPTDFSPCSDAALDCAKRLAANLRGSVCLLHVVEPRLAAVPFGSQSGAPDSWHARPDRTEYARVELGRRMLAGTGSGSAITGDIVCGASAAMISAYAARHAIDMIVMGSHGGGGAAQSRLGSVAETVISTARCPVLIVKPQHGTRGVAANDDVIAQGQFHARARWEDAGGCS